MERGPGIHDSGLVFLEVSDMIGSIGAEHYYGKLVWYEGRERHEQHVEHAMTQREAIYLNKKDTSRGSGMYKPGDMTRRFDTPADVIAAALQCWSFLVKTVKPRLLVLGSNCAIEPKIPLAGEVRLMAQAASLAERALDCRGCRNMDDPEYDRLTELWDEFTYGKRVKRKAPTRRKRQ